MSHVAILEPLSNQLLNFLSAKDRNLLTPNLKRIPLVLRQSLENANQAIETIYFPEDGVASVVGNSKSVGEIEIGIIGKEGMTGLMVVMGNDRSPYNTFVQVAGSALMLSARNLHSAMKKSSTLRDFLLHYAQVFMIQTSQTALANAAALLSQRLARWLLMVEDRLSTKEIPLTQEFLAIMLGVQRSGVSIAIADLESRGLISSKRKLIRILNRPALEKFTNGTYGLAEAEYKRRVKRSKSQEVYSRKGLPL
jgi:CRP-like cAMP-binding protein